MSKRHQSSRRRSYGRRQHEVHEREGNHRHSPTMEEAGLDAYGVSSQVDPFAFLDPRSERCGHADGACNACRQHDRNSLFPTSKAADGNRAHKGCNCCIQAGTLHYGTYVALFGNPKKLKRYRADKRTARVNALLKNHPAVFT